jgi:hypothetical protein
MLMIMVNSAPSGRPVASSQLSVLSERILHSMVSGARHEVSGAGCQARDLESGA